jgi:hypothetical protein
MITQEDEQFINQQFLKETDMNEGREYRFQADWSLGTKMYHVRCDVWEEFKESCKLMETMLPAVKQELTSFPDDQGSVAHASQEVVNVPMCPKHNKPLTNGKFGWYCQSKDPSGPKGWCTYKPGK